MFKAITYFIYEFSMYSAKVFSLKYLDSCKLKIIHEHIYKVKIIFI